MTNLESRLLYRPPDGGAEFTYDTLRDYFLALGHVHEGDVSTATFLRLLREHGRNAAAFYVGFLPDATPIVEEVLNAQGRAQIADSGSIQEEQPTFLLQAAAIALSGRKNVKEYQQLVNDTIGRMWTLRVLGFKEPTFYHTVEDFLPPLLRNNEVSIAFLVQKMFEYDINVKRFDHIVADFFRYKTRIILRTAVKSVDRLQEYVAPFLVRQEKTPSLLAHFLEEAMLSDDRRLNNFSSCLRAVEESRLHFRLVNLDLSPRISGRDILETAFKLYREYPYEDD